MAIPPRGDSGRPGILRILPIYVPDKNSSTSFMVLSNPIQRP